MFLKFSPALPHLLPVANALCAYFVIRHLQRHFYPAPHIPSIRDFFHRSGCISFLDSYADVLQGNPLPDARMMKTARWVYTRREKIGYAFCRCHACKEWRREKEAFAVVTPVCEQPGLYSSHYGLSANKNWHVEYEEAAACAPSSSPGYTDTACLAAMRLCSSGLTMALTRRLGCDRRGPVRDRKRDVNMIRLILM